jgi:hypothetical protein
MASWSTYGKRKVYRVPIDDSFLIVEHLGAVKKRKDGRYDWWRWPSRFHPTWDKQARQGVVDTEEGAMEIVLKGWDDVHTSRNN